MVKVFSTICNDTEDVHLNYLIYLNLYHTRLIQQMTNLWYFISPENKTWHFMQIVSSGDNLHEMSNPVFWENKKKKKYFDMSSAENLTQDARR